jgi:hypothetical protein
MVLVFPCSRLAAQDAQGTATTQPDAAPQTPPATDAASSQQTSRERLFGVMPDFLTVNNSITVKPLTTGQKYGVVTRTAFDWFQFGWYTTKSGIDQWNGAESGYGDGLGGYGKRWASNFTDGTSENYFVAAIWPSLLHQDPRYFRKGSGGFGSRAGYAVSRMFVTRGDSGHRQINFSEILGASTTTLVANLYHPAGDRTVDSNIELASELVGYDMLGVLIKEFWPEISKPLTRHHAKGAGAKTP